MSKRWWMIFVKEKVLSAQFVWRCTQFLHHALIECERRRSLSNIRAIMQAFLNRFRINVEEQWKESSKVEALLHHLQTLSEAGSKSVVFSQWTAFLDLLEIPLKRKNFCFVRLDGTLSQRQREQVLKNFSNIPAVAPSSESSIGQTKNVSIKRFIVKDSVEERMQQVQARKQRLIAGALTDEEVRSARIEELKMLFR
ncbi:hypothetical protein SELMODRAFT_430930 [Selaginella moellendorffii]|uniref:Helicase C-terminal domain-containing protein n=1 Tax=Selaginella moellendorffii TaxID=88036 RepID=D8TAZ9_SELML|nr:hypothetical protein SELMODRAFT_430930 [Selaginella moellendorffii]